MELCNKHQSMQTEYSVTFILGANHCV